MAKSKGSYSVIIKGCMDTFLQENNLSDLSESDTFELFSVSLLTKQIGISLDSISSSITDGGQDGGIDSIVVLVDDDPVDSLEDLDSFTFKESTVAKFLITQSKTESTFKETVIDKLISSANVLFPLNKSLDSLKKRFNESIIERTEILRKTWERTLYNRGSICVCVNYVCMAEAIETSSSFVAKQEQLIEDLKDIFSLDAVSLDLYSCDELLKLYQKRKDDTRPLQFKESPLSNLYSIGGNGIGYVGMVYISEFKKFITSDDHSIIEELFESNVRHYQGNVDVNNKIKETLQTVRDRDFWWLNNGITIIADSCSQMGPQLILTNPQIVNGLQTSFSIFQYFSEDSSDSRSVLVKVIVTSDKVIVDSIIASTNYQNSVAPGLLRATDDIQRDIESYFLNKGYFYDRRKNYYRNRGKQANRIFGIQAAAQAIKSIIGGEPNVARSNPSGLLKTDSMYNTIFNKNDNFQGYLNCCIITSWIHAYVLRTTNTPLGTGLRNFKLHLSWIIAILMVKSVNLNCEQIASLDMDIVDMNSLSEVAIKVLLDSIDHFRLDQPGMDVVNMAKSKDFVLCVKRLIKENYHEYLK